MFEIDERVQYLVEVLNDIPGVSTNSSCGGHEVVTICCQRPIDEFYVDLDIAENKKGWAALKIIMNAAQAIGAYDDFRIFPWIDGGLRWNLEGSNGLDPDELAEAIEQRLTPEE